MNKIAKMKEITGKARKAAAVLAMMSTEKKNKVLLAMSEGLDRAREDIKKANRQDLDNGSESRFLR